MRTRIFVNTLAVAMLAAVPALLAPALVEARTCESMGAGWFPSNQGSQCDASCSESCIVKWDCAGEACEPHHCWKCAAGSPPPPAPTPPPPDPVRDAGGVRCDAMGPEWFFNNQGNVCNEACSESCIPKWDCGGQPCRPTHCWKCAAGLAPTPPPPPDPNDPAPIRLPNALVDFSSHADEYNVYIRLHVEALNADEQVYAELRLKDSSGVVVATNSAQNNRSVDVVVTIPLAQFQASSMGFGWDDIVNVLDAIVRIGTQAYNLARRVISISFPEAGGCWTYTGYDSLAQNCLYTTQSKCGESKCVGDNVTLARASAAECPRMAKAKSKVLKFRFLSSPNPLFCLGLAVEGAETCSVTCSAPSPTPTPAPK